MYAGYGLAFALGCVLVVTVWYVVRGVAIQLSPVAFVSLVFTIVVGAASLVLAIVALNFGRISERVMTERADKSIDIQMNLFQKSLGLQTQLFDKTMSTLESIGRSTGVTEQRLGDIHSLIQSPGFLKQVAGRAVEQATSELETAGKGAEKSAVPEANFAEKLTKSIVEQLSTRLESLTRPSQPTSTPTLVTAPESPNPLLSTAARLQTERDVDEQIKRYKRTRELDAAKKHLRELLERAVQLIPGANIEANNEPLVKLWEYTVSYKGKRTAIDLRVMSKLPKSMEPYDRSIILLLNETDVDCLLFVYARTPDQQISEYIEAKNRAIGGRVRFIVASDEHQLQDDLLAILESVAAELPTGD